MSSRNLAAALGFGFAAIWATAGLTAATLCLVAAAIFYSLAALAEKRRSAPSSGTEFVQGTRSSGKPYRRYPGPVTSNDTPPSTSTREDDLPAASLQDPPPERTVVAGTRTESSPERVWRDLTAAQDNVHDVDPASNGWKRN